VLRRLASDAGIELKGGPSKKRDNTTERLKKLVSISEDFYGEYITGKSREAVAARAYLDDRDVTEESIKQFKIGLAPDAWDTLTVKATRAGYTPDELVKAGLAVPRKEGSGIYDRFRHRLLFPIYNSLGEPIGFGGRDLSGEDEVPKYINSPNSPIYNKSRVIYNLNKARPAIAAQNRVIVVEGYFDVLGLWQVGIENVVATSGTAMNEDLARTLVRFSKDIVMLFDGDAAGQAATRRAITRLLESGARVRVVTLPPGKDPFDISIAEGRSGIETLLEGAVDWVEFIFDVIRTETPGDDIGAKLAAIREIEKLLEVLPSDIERTFWMDRFGSLLGLSDAIRSTGKPIQTAAPDFSGLPAIKDVERNLLRILLKYPRMITDYGHKLERITFEDAQVSRIFAVLRDYAEENDALQPTLDKLDEEDSRLAVELVMFEIRDEDIGKAASLCIDELIRRSRKRGMKNMFRTGDDCDDEFILKFAEEQKDLRKDD